MVVAVEEAGMPADEQQRRLRATNTSVITLNHVIHHGAIGHHVQNAHAYAGMSEIGRIAAIDGACRIGMFLGGEKEGLLGITYKVSGPPGRSVLSVNPISAVAPGLFRKFFEFPNTNERPLEYRLPDPSR